MTKIDNIKNTISPCDIFENLRSHKIKMSKACDSKLFSEWAVIIIVIAFAATDAIVFFSTFETVLSDNIYMVMAMVVSVSIAEQLLGVLIAVLLRKYELSVHLKTPNKMHIVLSIMSVIILILMLLLSGFLRWNARELIDVTNQGSSLLPQTSTLVRQSAIDTLTIFVSILPLITTVIGFIFQYLAFNPIVKRALVEDLHAIKIVEDKIKLEATLKQILALDPKIYKNFVDSVYQSEQNRLSETAEIVNSKSNEAIVKSADMLAEFPDNQLRKEGRTI